ncbi:class I SAM-dependent methyltransferase [Bacillus sp. Marseille-P3800]|nr:class I SAM-dependent methyltransferase [Bacillus sp. Marseille-P3800]
MIDATLGMAADAILAQVAVGASGSVIGLEANPYIAFIVKHGLANWSEGDDQFTRSLQNIHVVQTENVAYLKACQSESVDVVYFDPMFEVRIHSPGLAGLKQFASYQSLTEEVVEEAKRVAKHKIVLKNPTSSSLFARLGFSVHYRPHASFQYGIIQKK